MRKTYRLALMPLFVLLALPLTGARLNGCTPEDLTCEERVQASSDYVDSVLEQHLSCKVDTDCTTVNTSTQCQGDCPSAVAVEGRDDVEAAVAYANETWCADYIEDGCPYATPDCMPTVPKCDTGTCVLEVVWY